jgi:hypothetical protein
MALALAHSEPISWERTLEAATVTTRWRASIWPLSSAAVAKRVARTLPEPPETTRASSFATVSVAAVVGGQSVESSGEYSSRSLTKILDIFYG